MNLLQDPWIPVRRQSGTETRIAPWQITETQDPILALAAPRPDFNGALLQFLIGLLQTAAAPEGEQWADWLEQPPSPKTLKACLNPFSQAFELDGKGRPTSRSSVIAWLVPKGLARLQSIFAVKRHRPSIRTIGSAAFTPAA